MTTSPRDHPVAIPGTLVAITAERRSQSHQFTRSQSSEYASALLHLTGEGVEGFATPYQGTVQWIGYSSFRPGHKRKNWFVGVQEVPIPETMTFSERDVRIETLRASGAGGQHVNTTDSAVRAVHLPTGLVAVAQEERSQSANRKRAIQRLGLLVARHGNEQQDSARRQRWDSHNELVRGNPVLVYEGDTFKRVR